MRMYYYNFLEKKVLKNFFLKRTKKNPSSFEYTLIEILSAHRLHNKKCGKIVTFLQGVRSKERDKKVHSYVPY
jgi:hypothetical protein